MTSSEKDCDRLKDLIPLYVKGLLSDAKRKEIESAIDACPSLRKEIDTWYAVEYAYQRIEGSLPQPSGSLYEKIAGRIGEAKNPGLLHRIFASPTISLAIVTAQLLLILSLGFYILQEKHAYKTMSAPSIKTGDYLMINVIFREQSTESEIRELLLKINGRIVDGPTRSGLYIVGLKARQQGDSALETLRKSALVKMAEKAY